MLDYKALKEAMTKNAIDNAAALQMEIMLSKVEAQDLTRQIQKLLQGNSESDKIFKDKI
jgi:FtsZ-binding cell division protein ZapB